MHVLFRESHGLDEADTPRDLGQAPAELVVLSFSDSDLGAFAAGWRRGRNALPTLRLANLALLTHPLSVDTYIDRTLGQAKGILIRLIGGASWWAYGLEQVSRMARSKGIALAVLPADGRPDPALDAASTLPVATLRRLTTLCEAGGEIAAQGALAQLALAAGLYAGPVPGPKTLPGFGFWHPDTGPLDAGALPLPGTARPGPVASPTPPPLLSQVIPGGDGGSPSVREPLATGTAPRVSGQDAPLVALPFYRAWLAAADTAAVTALIRAFEAAGFRALGLFVPSLKAPDAARWLQDVLPQLAPVAVVNTTAFSARLGAASPLDAAQVPVFQAIHATARRSDWAASDRGLSPADLAMHVALPEVDGRIGAGVISFKELSAPDPDLQYAAAAHAPDAEGIAAVVTRVAGWHRLATLPEDQKRVTLVLSTYPGRAHRMAHAVGLDALASAEAMLTDLAEAGLDTGVMDPAMALHAPPPDPAPLAPLHSIPGLLPDALPTAGQRSSSATPPASPAPLEQALATERILWPLSDYRRALASLPETLRLALQEAHGAPEDDPAVTQGSFPFAATRRGKALVALQPERGRPQEREDSYHDTSRVPCHAYVAFYLWLQRQSDALVHVGAHGTLEWLPGKSAALSAACWPQALTGALPVLYPFIVNDPGEAAQARRRIGAVTLGHLPPPLVEAGLPEGFHRLERLLDEYSTADGLDPARRLRLIAAIRAEAQSTGIEADLDLPEDASPAEAIPRIDRFVCDVKDSQFGEGLHVWGRGTPAAPSTHFPSPNIPGGASGSPSVREPLATGAEPRGLPQGDPASGEPKHATSPPELSPPHLLSSNIPGSGAAPRGLPQGDPASIAAERAALLTALQGKPIQPGPSGSPWRGRADVLPTGRNLYGTDPRAVPSRAAHAQGVKLAEELVRRHLQDQGDYPRGLVVNLWGSATMRTAGEEFAIALHLAGLAPQWDEGSDRVTGYSILPLALMDRPRIEVTLRVSGLFRDVFPDLCRLFEAATLALAARDEAADMNPYTAAAPGPRVFAPAPGSYGLGLSTDLLTEEARSRAGEAWLAASSHDATGTPARPALEARLKTADSFVHAQDLPETDLLLAEDYAAHEAGFAAAMARIGAARPAIYHLDATRPEAPQARPLAEEIARVTRARAANPRWLAGMMNHGFRGAAEIAATLDHLSAFAHLAQVVPPHLFDLYHAATLEQPEIRAFLQEANPGALAAMEARFAALAEAGLWRARSNSRAMGIGAAHPAEVSAT